jgi:1-acyl-sn-glycerol-3-phosphate acyltransferase
VVKLIAQKFVGESADVVMSHFVSFFCRVTLRFIGIKVKADNLPPIAERRGAIIVANHISYIDALVLNGFYRAKFITSEEIGSSAVLGVLTKAGGCAFVERRRKMRLRKDLNELSKFLTDGNSVMFFPEGTTGPGYPILPFKSSLLEAAMRTGASVVVFSIAYPIIDGEKVDSPANDKVAWYGDMSFFPHMWNVLKMRATVCELSYLGKIRPITSGGRKELGGQVSAMIEEKLRASYLHGE